MSKQALHADGCTALHAPKAKYSRTSVRAEPWTQWAVNLTAAGELLVSNGRAVGEDEVYLLQVRPPTLYTVQHATCSVQRAACNM